MDITSDRKLALERTLQFHRYNKLRYDKGKLDIPFANGDLVLVDNGNKLNRNKLDPLRFGPFKITRTLCNNVYELVIKKRKKLYHASKLIPYSFL